MALTGLLLVLFVLVHLAENLLLYADETGEIYDGWVALLTANKGFLYTAEIVLALLFVAHIALGVKLTLENRDARRTGYRLRANHGGRTPGSGTMAITGLLVLVFLVIHLLDFRFGHEEGESMAALVKERLGSSPGWLIYALGVLALALHLSHGVRSIFQSLGISHPKYDRGFQVLGWIVAVLVGLGFLSFPIAFWLGGNA